MVFWTLDALLFLELFLVFGTDVMTKKQHNIDLQLLREGEEVLHNCSSHAVIHLKLPALFLVILAIPYLAVFFLVSGEVITESSSVAFVWFLYAVFGLIASAVFWMRTMNFEMGGCVITNQRVLRFGFRGLSNMVEREILPNKIEDVKVVRKGMMSMLFGAADVLIHTSNGEVETLRSVTEAKKIQETFSQLLSSLGKKPASSGNSPENTSEGTWIDDALGQTEGEAFDVDEHREDTIDQIGDVFRNGKQ